MCSVSLWAITYSTLLLIIEFISMIIWWVYLFYHYPILRLKVPETIIFQQDHFCEKKRRTCTLTFYYRGRFMVASCSVVTNSSHLPTNFRCLNLHYWENFAFFPAIIWQNRIYRNPLRWIRWFLEIIWRKLRIFP